jgi:hypothetical protein
MKALFYGAVFIVLCTVFYLVWWIAAFSPGEEGWLQRTNVNLWLIPSTIFGILGIIVSIVGLQSKKVNPEIISTLLICIVGIVLYFGLLAFTWFVMKRSITTELFLLTGWLTLTFCMVNAAYGYDLILHKTAIILFVVAAIAFVIGLICYILYYAVSPSLSFILGMIPLIIIMGYDCAFAVLVRL